VFSCCNTLETYLVITYTFLVNKFTWVEFTFLRLSLLAYLKFYHEKKF